MKNNLRISNMVCTGKLPFKRKLRPPEVDRLILKSDWMIVNEEYSPLLAMTVSIRKNLEMSVHNKVKQPYVSIWTTGAINIVGVITKKEADQVYDIVLKDIRRLCRSVLK